MDPVFRGVRGFAGMTTLPDGVVALILDLGTMMEFGKVGSLPYG